MNNDYEILKEGMSQMSVEVASNLSLTESVSLLGHNDITATRFENLKNRIIAEKQYDDDAATLEFIKDQVYGGQRTAVADGLPLAQWDICREGDKRFVKIALDGLAEGENVSI